MDLFWQNLGGVTKFCFLLATGRSEFLFFPFSSCNVPVLPLANYRASFQFNTSSVSKSSKFKHHIGGLNNANVG